MAAFVVAGCGGSGSSETAASRPTPTAAATSTPAKTPAPQSTPDPTAKLRRRLKHAGFDVANVGRGSDHSRPVGALGGTLQGTANLTVYVYRTEAQARHSARAFAPVIHQHPDQIKVAQHGPDVYVGTVEEPAKLPAAAFTRAVSAGGY